MSETVSNVDLDLTGVSIQRPVFDQQTVLCTVAKCGFLDSEGEWVADRSLAKNIGVELVFEQAARSTTGREVTPGYKHTDRINLVASGRRTPEMVRETVARFQCAALGIKEPKAFVPEEQVGRRVNVIMKTRTDRDDPSKVYQDCRYVAAL